jgi:hypothetical protein
MGPPFAVTLSAVVAANGAITTFTVITERGTSITTGQTSWVFPTGKLYNVMVVDGSNRDGAFHFRIYLNDGETQHAVIDVVSPQAGEVMKNFAVESPLLEILGDGTLALEADALALDGSPNANAFLTILVAERPT